MRRPTDNYKNVVMYILKLTKLVHLELKKTQKYEKRNFCWYVTFLGLDYDIRNNATNMKLK